MIAGREVVIMLVCAAMAMMHLAAQPTRSNAGAQSIAFSYEQEEGLIPRAYEEKFALIAVTNRNAFVGINSMVSCPSEGNIWIEVDYAAQTSSNPYIKIAGLVPCSGNTFSLMAYVNWNQVQFVTGVYTTYFRMNASSFNIKQNAFSCGFGIIDDKDVITINNTQTVVHEMKGGERGNGEFIYFGRSGTTYDAFQGMVIGRARIYVRDELAFEGVPCIRKSDGLAGYYDIVNRRFCPNLGGMEAIDMEEQ